MSAGDREASPPPKRTLSEDVFGATLWNSLLLPLRVAVSLFTSVVYYQVLPRPEVGVILLLQNLANTLGLYIDLGIERTLPRFLPEVEEGRGRGGVGRILRHALTAKVAILLPVVASLFLLATPLARSLSERQRATAQAEQLRAERLSGEAQRQASDKAGADLALAGEVETRRYLFLGAVALLIACGALHDVFMQSLNAFFRRREWNAITLVGNLLQPVLVSTLVLLGFGIPGVLVGLVATPLVGLALSARAVRRMMGELRPTQGPQDLPADLRPRFVRFAATDYLFQLSTWLYDLPFLVLFAAQRLSFEALAVLGFSYKFAKDFLTYVYWPLIGLVTPVLARVRARGSDTALKDAYASLVRILGLVLIPAGVGLCLLTPHLVRALYPKFLEASPLAVVFVAFVFLDMLLGVAQTTLMTLERYRPLLILRATALCSPLVLAVTLERFGLVGAAWGMSFLRVLPPLLITLFAWRVLGLAFPLGFLGRVALASLAFALPLRYWLGPPPTAGVLAPQVLAVVPLLGYAALGALVFLLALKATGGLHPDDRRRLFELRLPFKDGLARLV
jgi:O-antigen/teichoic acid export membrane protein